jgi:hypothetical protein
MGEKIRGHIRANVVGYVALFFSLGLGTAWASHETILSSDIVDGEVKTQDIGSGQVRTVDLGTNSVTSGRIAGQAVQSSDVANDTTGNALTGTDVLNNSLTGDDINESSLSFECLAGYELAGKDVCYDDEHAFATFDTALSTCAGSGDRLPTLAEGMAVMTDLPNPPEFTAHQTWTADQSSGTAEATFLTKDVLGTITRASVDTSESWPFRCVTSPAGHLAS